MSSGELAYRIAVKRMPTSSAPGWFSFLPPAAGEGLVPVLRSPSPFFNERPAGQTIRLLVVHGISLPEGEYGGPHVEDLFLGRLDPAAHPSFESLQGLEVSSHFFIDRLGQCTQFVSIADRAWHAGRSTFQGEDNCNDFSIGVELEGTDLEPYELIQLARLAQLTITLHRGLPSLNWVTGHADVAPGRKTDPGPHFDWPFFDRLLRAEAPTIQLSLGQPNGF